MKLKISFLAILLLSACTVGPDYHRPCVVTPAKFKEAGKGWKIAKPNAHCQRKNWWKVFHEAKLDQLENRLNACNQNIAVAAARYCQALAVVDQQRAAFFP